MGMGTDQYRWFGRGSQSSERLFKRRKRWKKEIDRPREEMGDILGGNAGSAGTEGTDTLEIGEVSAPACMHPRQGRATWLSESKWKTGRSEERRVGKECA